MKTTRLPLHELRALYERSEPLAMVTAYDYTSAHLVDAAGIPLILVGDSLGMVVQGLDGTINVTLDQICYHTRCVTRGASRAHVVADLPFLTYTNPLDAVRHAGRLLTEGGAQSVKLEGGARRADVVQNLVGEGIPVMGHVGYTPQSTLAIGARVQGKSAQAAATLIRDCLTLQEVGVWGIVLELIPSNLARAITELLDIPTIGIGAGPDCSGQVQVWHDMLGLYPNFTPRHTHRFAEAGKAITDGLTAYQQQVLSGEFPSGQHSSRIDDGIVEQALALSRETR